ncbi:MAG: WD40/YVTN/BNR-like repeat-containing protein, partial [Gemmatimonadota bacterium]
MTRTGDAAFHVARTVPAACIALVAAACGGYGGGGASGGDYGARADPTEDGPGLVTPVLERQARGTTAPLQAVSPVSEEVAWASGHEGTWARTLDGGATWTTGVVPGADTLQFRDVHAHSADLAWLLSAGPGELSRIYHTDDGGASWTLQWTNEEPEGFYDCLDFWDAERGAVYGDAVAGELRILRTTDGGERWTFVDGSTLPQAQLNEGGFAASGTCLVTGAEGRAWVAAGNAAIARVLHTDDFGES